MREFKKYFFESLIQLTILANVFRENSRHTQLNNNNFDRQFINHNHHHHHSSSAFDQNSTVAGELDLLFLSDNFNLHNSNHNNNTNQTNSTTNRDTYLNNNYRAKEVESYINDLRLINRLNRLASPATPILNQPQFLPDQNLFLLPASFLNNSNNNQKSIVDLSETRLLLNSIELNSNNPTLRKEFEMDIELQNLIEQDIDLGIKKGLYYNMETSSMTEPFDKNLEAIKQNELVNTLKNQIGNQFEESQKDQDIITFTKFLENQKVPEGFKLFVEEDTGEIFYISLNEKKLDNKSENLSEKTVSNISLAVNSTNKSTTINREETTQLNFLNKTGTSSEGDTGDNFNINLKYGIILTEEAIMTMKIGYGDAESQQCDSICKNGQSNLSSNNIQKPTENNETTNSGSINSLDNKPLFLSQKSVAKELNKLNENSEISNNNITRLNIDDSFMMFNNETLLNELLINNYDDQKANIDIQQDLDSQQQQQQQQQHEQNIQQDTLISKTNNLIQADSLIQANLTGDGFMFDDEFLTNFEANLNRLDSLSNQNEHGQTNYPTSSEVYFNQTVLSQAQNFTNGFIFNSNDLEIQSTVLESTEQSTSSELLQTTQNENAIIKQLQTELGLNQVLGIFNDSSINITNSNLTNYVISNNVSSTLTFPTDKVFISTLTDNTQNNNNDGVNKKLNNKEDEDDEYDDNNDEDDYDDDDDDDEAKNSIGSNPANINIKQEVIDVDDKLNENNTIDLPNGIQMLAASRGLHHNHTYLSNSNSEAESEVFHPYSYKNRLKKMLKNMKNNETNSSRQPESRDQMLLVENGIQLTMAQIVESNADEFNELIKSASLNQDQMNIVKDIRRRGKNKVAAQICRKRKIDSIDSLKDEVDQLRDMRSLLQSEHQSIQNEIKDLTMKFDDLYKDLMGDNYDASDPIIVYMSNLKSQLNNKFNSKQTIRNLNSEESDSNSHESETGSQSPIQYIDSNNDDSQNFSQLKLQIANTIDNSISIKLDNRLNPKRFRKN